jgi:hypothetical protein
MGKHRNALIHYLWEIEPPRLKYQATDKNKSEIPLIRIYLLLVW